MKTNLKSIALFFVLLFLLVGFIWFLTPLKILTHPKWTFYDKNNEVLYSEHPYSPSKTETKSLGKWLVAVEDKRFFQHIGVDFLSLARAAQQNTNQHRIVSGGSTITMQLARQLYLANEPRNWWYKIRQIALALRLDFQYSKQEILEQYLQNAYLGRSVTGFTQAAQYYFSKPVSALSLSEKATLIGLLPQPELANPVNNLQQAQLRRNLVLSIWQEQSLITPAEYQYWQAQPLKLHLSEKIGITAPHFLFWVKQQLKPLLPTNKSEFKVYTTLDKNLYHQTLTIARNIFTEADQKNISNASAIILDKKANLRLMLGSIDFFNKNIDGAVNIATASREMGSTLKPFLFALALEKGKSPLDTVDDLRQSFLENKGSYSPRNYKPHVEHGRVRFKESLAGSYNIGAVDLLQDLGVEVFHQFLKDLNFRISKSPQEVGLSLVLGSGESRLLDLTRAFSTFLQRGKLPTITFFTEVRDEHGNILLKTPPKTPTKQIMRPDTAEWVLHSLSDNEARWSNFERGNALELDFPVAVKTGTSQDFRDNYVVGTSTEYTVGVWAGNTDGTPMRQSAAVNGSGPFWHKIMRVLHPYGAPEFKWQSKRKETIICRKAWEDANTCTEKMVEFLLPNETNHAVSAPKLSISFPSNGDKFHPDSSITVQVRNTSKPFEVFLDGKPVSPILKSLPTGKHIIEVRQNEQKDSIAIFVEPR